MFLQVVFQKNLKDLPAKNLKKVVKNVKYFSNFLVNSLLFNKVRAKSLAK